LAEEIWDELTKDIPWDVTDIEIDRMRKNVAFVVNEDGASKVYLLDASTFKRTGPLELPLVDSVGQASAAPVSDENSAGQCLCRNDARGGAFSGRSAMDWVICFSHPLDAQLASQLLVT
jgi:hypothetical protein